MKARHCEDCEHFEFKWPYEEAECFMGYKPRFYQPRNPNDYDWGWKRRCEDFEPKADYAPLPKEQWEDEYLGGPYGR